MISVVIPAYNAQDYIREAVESIIAQSYGDWELIVVDDCSSDRTVSILSEYSQKHSNIRIIQRDHNSGGCRLPRFDGILAACGDFVLSIDADDVVERDFLLKMLERQKETKADIVLDRMVFCDERGVPTGRAIPNYDFDMSQIIGGRDAVKMTIGGWQLAMNGMLVCRRVFQHYVKDAYTTSFKGGFAIEIDQRKLLLPVSSVAMVDAHYYYRMHSNSITHDVSIRSFDSVIAQDYLYQFVESNFADDKEIISKAQGEYIENLFRSNIKYLSSIRSFTRQQRIMVRKIIEGNYTNMKERRMVGRSIVHKIITLNIFALDILSYMVLIRVKLR